jgi:pyruvate dehydrogenase phosphatase
MARLADNHVGHGGNAAVEYVIEAVPGDLKGRLSSLISFASSTSVAVEPHAVSAIIQQALSAVDDRITQDLKDIIPGGVEQLAKMSDDEIKQIINDQEQGSINVIKLRRALSGSTALIALQDPSKENLWIAGLGDCSASKLPAHFSYPGTHKPY